MCEQCIAQTTLFGEIFKGIYLVRATKDGHIMQKGNWGLVVANDPFFIFEHTPKLTKEEDNITNSEEEFLHKIINLSDINRSTESIILEFYAQENKSFPLWLNEKIAQFIEKIDINKAQFYDEHSEKVARELGTN